MKMVIKGALALALLASTAGSALAQDQAEDHDRWHNAGERARPQARQEGPRQEAPRAETPRAQPQAQAQAPQQQAQPRNQQGPGGWQRGPDGRNFRGAADNQRGDGQRGDGQRGDGQRGRDRNVQQPAPAAQPAAPAPQNRANDPRQGGDRRWEGDRNGRPDGNRGDNRNNGRNDGRNDGRGWNDNRDNQWRGGDHRQDRPRYDPRNYPRQWHSPQRYRGYNYRPPPGFYSRSWVFGDVLPRAWWTPDYRLDSWWDYNLPIPPIGYEWVRVGDDALLVDIYSGRVVQVAYDIFW
jgi:Ni/Co efflux regulator RcnB